MITLCTQYGDSFEVESWEIHVPYPSKVNNATFPLHPVLLIFHSRPLRDEKEPACDQHGQRTSLHVGGIESLHNTEAANASWAIYIVPINTFTVSQVRSMLTLVMLESLSRLIWQHRPEHLITIVVSTYRWEGSGLLPIAPRDMEGTITSMRKVRALRRLPNGQHIRLRGRDYETCLGFAHQNWGGHRTDLGEICVRLAKDITTVRCPSKRFWETI